MLEIGLCDDNLQFLGKVETLLYELRERHGIKLKIEVFGDGEEIVKAVLDGMHFDIIYMDIEMNRKNGLEAADEIRRVDNDVILIYLTSYESYMPKTFDYRPFQFMIKPIDNNMFERHFMKAYTEISKKDFYFHFKYNKVFYRVLIRDIIYFESDKRIVVVVSKNSVYRFYDKLDVVEATLKESKVEFLRIHKSYLVNFGFITEISYDRVKLINGKVLFISEERRKGISKKYCDIVGNQNIWL